MGQEIFCSDRSAVRVDFHGHLTKFGMENNHGDRPVTGNRAGYNDNQ
jgi:hypothetical protein